MPVSLQINWKKMGKIDNGHAQLPVVKMLDDGTARIYVTDRSPENISFIRTIDFDLSSKTIVSRDVFARGTQNSFDEDGVMTSCLSGGNLYYTAWKKLPHKKYKHSIAMIDIDSRIKSLVIDSTELDNYLCSSPFIVCHNDEKRMWFISGRDCGGWTDYGPMYTIRHAISRDGINWEQQPIEFKRKDNEVFARPFVLFENGLWKMWYSFLFLEKSKCYRIGYAESSDGISWTRLDHLAGLGVSEDGWDSETVAFPYLIKTNQSEIMFYSGNHFGQGGIGYAVRQV